MRSKLILIMALVMGIVTTVLFFNYMKKFDEASLVNESLTDVVAAKQAIKKNELVTAAELQMIKVPIKGLHAETIKSVAEAVGKISNTDLAPGEVLLSHHLQNEKEEALFVSRKVHDGYRALSVGVNLVRSVSNLIEPNDFVDVVSTPNDKNNGIVSTLILENVRVLAIGRRMIESGTDTPYVEYSSVTLEVKPQDGVNVINAGEKGNISLMLHTRVVPPSATAKEGSGNAK
ncbi:MAG: cpaB [Bacilli bacterium]|nr:cpaB [Bacilli bacterium]